MIIQKPSLKFFPSMHHPTRQSFYAVYLPRAGGQPLILSAGTTPASAWSAFIAHYPHLDPLNNHP